jgi:hypothetical protein
MKRPLLTAASAIILSACTTTGPYQARTPYWIVQVPGEIINNHGGIWDPNAQALMAAIFRLNFPVREKTGVATAPESLRLPATRRY